MYPTNAVTAGGRSTLAGATATNNSPRPPPPSPSQAAKSKPPPPPQQPSIKNTSSSRGGAQVVNSFSTSPAFARDGLNECSGSANVRHVYFVRHAEAGKNVMPGNADKSTPGYDALTPKGEAQARDIGQRLKGRGITAVVSSAENRTIATAAAITSALGLSTAKLEPNLISKIPKSQRGGTDESQMERASRGLGATERFLAATGAGDVAVVAHGQISDLMIKFSQGRSLEGPTTTMDNGSVSVMMVEPKSAGGVGGVGGYKWTLCTWEGGKVRNG